MYVGSCDSFDAELCIFIETLVKSKEYDVLRYCETVI